jgi:hypothetical protein
LQWIAEGRVADSGGEPVRNPAIPHEPKGPDNSSDNSPDLHHVRALAVAADALVGVDPERSRELLRELIRLLDRARRGELG